MGKNNIISQVVNTAIDIVEQVTNPKPTKLHTVAIITQKKLKHKPIISITKENPTVRQIKVFNPKKNKTISQTIENAQPAQCEPIENAQPAQIVNTNHPMAITNTHKEITTKYLHPTVRQTVNNTTGTFNVFGASVRGTSHFTSNDPCQDYCTYEDLGNGWGIAVTADGAGSCKLSQKGSKANCIQTIKHFKEIANNYGWIKNNYKPSELEWYNECVNIFKHVYNNAKTYAEKHNMKASELSATVIVTVHTPYGLLTAHIGDGRSAYLNSNNQWISTTTPHKGEEANQTVFLHSNMHTIVGGFKMNGLYVPNTQVITDEVKAFVLTSDGCEKATWQCSSFVNEQWTDPNKAHAPFYNNLIKHLNVNKDNADKIIADILQFAPNFKGETDDKTMLIGFLKS